MLKNKSVFALRLFVLCNVLLSSAPLLAQESLTLQIHPYLPASELLKKFTPLTEYLSRKTDKKITCNISRDYQEHINIVGNDKIDMAYLGPASYIKITGKYGKKPILARLEIKGRPFFQGVIFTAKSASIRNLKDLAGKRFAFGDPDSTMSHLVPVFMLHKAGVSIKDLAKYSFLKSHDNVALGVLMGDFDAGAVKEEVFYQYKDRGLKDLAWSPKISEHLLVVRTSLPDTTVNELRAALLTLKTEPDARAIMSSIKNNMTAFVPADDMDYDNLRAILQELKKIQINP